MQESTGMRLLNNTRAAAVVSIGRAGARWRDFPLTIARLKNALFARGLSLPESRRKRFINHFGAPMMVRIGEEGIAAKQV
jgi:hypothetical protein